MTFVLHPKLEADTAYVCDLPLSQVRLSYNAAFPWMILIPRKAAVTEIMDLAASEQQLLLSEIVLSSQVMRDLYKPTKLNVANLGNVVSQLHVHVIARFSNDLAWPNPVWNSQIEATYSAMALQQRVTELAEALQG